MELIQKNEKLSISLRSQGNSEFKKQRFLESLLMYNKSLCFAETPESLSLCYGNRSAVYLHLKLYECCLNNIKLARKDCPKEIKKKLEEREEKCLSEYLASLNKTSGKSSDSTLKKFLKLSYPANPKLPFAVDCLELKENEKFGKHIVTSRKLKAGDVIAITPNIYNIIHEEAIFHHCSFCLRSNDMDLMPCPNSSKAMFCSRWCMRSDTKVLQCVTLNTEQYRNLLMFEKFHMRLLLRSQNAIRKLSLYNSPDFSVFDFDFSGCRNKMFCTNMLLAAIGGKSHNQSFDWLSLLGGIDDQRVLEATKMMAQIWQRLPQVIIHTSEISVVSSKKINEGITREFDFNLKVNILGLTFHPLSMLFSFSCVPNIEAVVFPEQGVTAFIVKRPIEAGSQLFKSFQNGQWNLMIKEKRQEKIMALCGFKCDCEACENNWEVSSVSDLRVLQKDYPEARFNREKAYEQFKENCDYINKNHTRLGPLSGKIIRKVESNSFCLFSITRSPLFN